MKLRKAFAGTAAAAVAVSALAVSAGASLLIVENAPSHLSSGSGMWMAKIYCPSENIDFGIDYASIKTVKFQITTDDTDFFEGMFGGAVVMSCGPASLCPEDHNWIQKSFWGCIDEENGFETQDAAADLLAETLGDYTYQLTLNVDASNCLYAVDSPDAYAQIALMEWGQDMSQIVVKGMQCYDEAGNVVIAFDGEGNLVSGAADTADDAADTADDAADTADDAADTADDAADTADDAADTTDEANEAVTLPATDDEKPVVTEEPVAGDVAAATDSTKGSPDTGVADVAAVAGLAIVAAGAVVVAKKRK